VIAKVCEVGKHGCNFCEITNGYWLVGAQTVRFNKESFFLELCQKVILHTVKLDVADAAITEQVTSDAYVCLALTLLWVVETLKYFLKATSLVSNDAVMRMIWVSLLGVQSTRDNLSFSIMWKSLFIMVIGLKFSGAIGLGKNEQNARSKSHNTKYFETEVSGGLEGAVRAAELAWEGLAAMGGTMVERGDQTSIHVGFSHRKAYWVRNDLFIFCFARIVT